MTHSGIECFLAICRHKTISRAADSLFITQSSLSMRLKTLEAELGGSLFVRQKGCREISLTAEGKRFYDLAVRFEELEEEMQNLFAKHPDTLKVSSFNSLGTYFLPKVVDLFLKKYPQTRLELQDFQLDEAEPRLRSGLTDIAFTSGTTKDKNLTRIPVFREPTVILCGSNLELPEKPKKGDLPHSGEVYFDWGARFSRWYKEAFSDIEPKIVISIMPQLHRFLEDGNTWAFAPVSIAKKISEECGLRLLFPEFDVPSREISLISSPDVPMSVADSFCECLREVVSQYPEIELLDKQA